MSQDDYLYYRQRAEVELDRARDADNAQAGAIHRELARAYLDRATLRVLDEPVGRSKA